MNAFRLAVTLSALALSACGGGGDGGGSTQSPQSTGTVTQSAPTPAPAPAPTNHAPSISGNAPTIVNAAMSYSFVPQASDPEGNPLTFSIQNKPAWASFAADTGTLSGTPSAADVGTYSGIQISVSDGSASSALGAFAIAVTAIAEGRVTLSWIAPTENTDGSPLADLAGYRIRYGTSAQALNNTIVVDNASVTAYVIENLSPATWYFAVTAVTAAGLESEYSNLVNKQI